ncbi:MAG TPA: histidine kinase [Gemmatimonadaceae bacterium]|jgi:signal transduction histidine kinase|nr:histidine kinase [Gemmatimonadaceae bacterium]
MPDNARPEGPAFRTDVPDGQRRTRTSSRTVFSELGWRAFAFNVAFWTLFGALQASSRLLLPSGDIFPFPAPVIASALLRAYMWALLTPAIFWFAARVAPDQGIHFWRVAQVLLIGLVVGALASAVSATGNALLIPRPGPPGSGDRGDLGSSLPARTDLARNQAAPPRTSDVRRAPASPPRPAPGMVPRSRWRMALRALRSLRGAGALRRWYFQEVVTFFGVFVAGLVSDLSRRSRAREREAARFQAQASQLQAEQAELRARAAQLQAQSAGLHAQLADARLVVLRTRLNPHFLFNTLNAVSALVASDPKAGRDMIALLSELLRHALAESREQEIPLREEVRLLRLYLEILEIRYQGQLRTEVTADAGVHDALVPNMILQPLVENAMKHGIDRAGGHGAIEVRASRAGDDLVLTVRDTGPRDDSAPSPASTGIGLRITRERLAELYGTEQRLELTSTPGGGMTARVVLPYHEREVVRYSEAVAHT